MLTGLRKVPALGHVWGGAHAALHFHPAKRDHDTSICGVAPCEHGPLHRDALAEYDATQNEAQALGQLQPVHWLVSITGHLWADRGS